MSFHPFQKFIPRAANVYGISREMQAAHICHQFEKLIPEYFDLAKNPSASVRAAHYKNQELTIAVSTPAWAQEVTMRKHKIIEDLNAKMGREVIKNLKTQLNKHLFS